MSIELICNFNLCVFKKWRLFTTEQKWELDVLLKNISNEYHLQFHVVVQNGLIFQLFKLMDSFAILVVAVAGQAVVATFLW